MTLPENVAGSLQAEAEQAETERAAAEEPCERRYEPASVLHHELRTPLTAIQGALGLLAGGTAGELPEKARLLVDIAARNTERLVRLINDLLELEIIQPAELGGESLDARRRRQTDRIVTKE